MTILIISESRNLEENYLNLFSENYIEDRSDLIIVYSFDEAKRYIDDYLYERQTHIDLIFIEINSSYFLELTGRFGNYLKGISYDYSSNNFKVNSIPVILYKDTYHNYETNLLQQYMIEKDAEGFLIGRNFNFSLFNGVLTKNKDLQKIGIHDNVVANGLDQWLDDLNSDLDTLNIDHTDRFSLNIDHYNRVEHKIKILSEKFCLNSKKLDYLWIKGSDSILERNVDELFDILQKYESNPKLREEKKIHDFLKKADYLLKGEHYVDYFYEKHFHFPETRRKYVESDFINIPYPYSHQKKEIFEVKLPSERFVTKVGERRLLRIAQKYFNQVGHKYNKYFHDPVYLKELTQRFKEENYELKEQDFKLTLLMGREYSREENIDIINEKLIYGNRKVKLFTYDNLIDRHNFLMQRVKRFGLR